MWELEHLLDEVGRNIDRVIIKELSGIAKDRAQEIKIKKGVGQKEEKNSFLASSSSKKFKSSLHRFIQPSKLFGSLNLGLSFFK